MTRGYVFYENGSACNGSIANITNLKTSNEWNATTNAGYNYYQLILANGTDVNATGVLRFNVTSPDGNHSNITEHTVMQKEVNNGSFELNITLAAAPASPCFIATAAYGTPLHEDIDVLRDFRDKYLMTNPTGRTFVGIYYKTSPPIADVIRENEGLRTAVRSLFVTPMVYIADAALT